MNENPDHMPIRAVSTRICKLNDALRTQGRGGKIMLTSGVSNLPEGERNVIIAAVRAFDGFNRDNDPHGEHDCAVVELPGYTILFKIDYYDRSMQYHSPDPANEAVTMRVLTIMLADEY